MKILIVEDELKLAGFLKKGLAQEGFVVDAARSAAEAERLTLDGVYDAIVLDLGLPDKDGLAMLRLLREEGDSTPVLILTARGSVEEKVRALEMGANDYLTKPFAFRELVARLKVLMRPAGAAGDVLRAGDLTLDVHSRKAERSGKPIALTNKEFAILELLMRSAGRPVSRARLWEHAWEGSFELDSNVLEVHIGRLRRKIGGRGSLLIETVRGVGYRIETAPGRKTV